METENFDLLIWLEQQRENDYAVAMVRNHVMNLEIERMVR